MKRITVKSIDTSTIAPGKGSDCVLPVLERGSKVTVISGEKSVTFKTGHSTVYQLCAEKGTGRGLHDFLTGLGASAAKPAEFTLEYGSEG